MMFLFAAHSVVLSSYICYLFPDVSRWFGYIINIGYIFRLNS